MIDFNSPIGGKIERRLRQEMIIWLTTVDSQNTPQPRPVWFSWDGETVLIFSQVNGAKLRHITHNPKVALNFNTDADGGEVGVLTGEAHILPGAPPASRMEAYVEKYLKEIQALGMSVEDLKNDYSVTLLVTPHALRGF
jgi:PPOX class probable F420-dependent enzyme